MKIKFCGAARVVTGSCHLITLDNGYKVLLDCGLYQGSEDEFRTFNNKWLFDPKEIDCLILSHAHIDHTGRVPKLVRDGFKGPIFATHATRSLCSIMLLDSAKIQERDAEWANKKRLNGHAKHEPLYTSQDVKKTMQMFRTYGYDQWFEVGKGIQTLYRDAGHILGSANVTLRIRENRKTRTIGFSGDIGRPDRPILRDPQEMPKADYVISESTYGNRDHAHAPDERERFLKIIKQSCVEKKGKLIIPAFSIGRTQEIVYMMDQLTSEGRMPHIPVYVDSPLAVNATEIYGLHPECYDNDLNEYMLTDDNPFGFRDLTYIKKVEGSKKLNHSKKPCIIISAAGMMQAGRIVHHTFNNIEDPKNTFLLVGYCAPNTLGGRLRNGAKKVTIFGEHLNVNASIMTMDSFSAHGDRNEMMTFLDNQKRQTDRLFLVHGEYKTQLAFREMLTEHSFRNIDIPSLGKTYNLD